MRSDTLISSILYRKSNDSNTKLENNPFSVYICYPLACFIVIRLTSKHMSSNDHFFNPHLLEICQSKDQPR